MRPTSARWAWVEYVLAQGGSEAGLRAYAAHQKGIAAWRSAFAGYSPRPLAASSTASPGSAAVPALAKRRGLPVLGESAISRSPTDVALADSPART